MSRHSYVMRLVRSVHCWVSSGSCLAVSACVSAHSLSGSPRCALILTKKVRAPCCVLTRRHSMIGLMMSALASPTSDAFGPLPIHDRILSNAVSLSIVSTVTVSRDKSVQSTSTQEARAAARTLVRHGGGPPATRPHRPRLVASHSTRPPSSPPLPAHSFYIGPAVINKQKQREWRAMISSLAGLVSNDAAVAL